MRARLPTTPLRVLGASILGVLFPTAVLFTYMRLNVPIENPLPLLLSYGLSMLVLGIPGALGWLVLHVLGVRILGASLAGAVSGGVLMTLSTTPQASIVALQMFGFSFVICAISTALVWWVAYPRALRPQRAAEAFT